MLKYKERKIKISRKYRSIIFTLICLICFIYLIYPLNSGTSTYVFKVDSPDDIINSFSFEGEKKNKMVFDNKYAALVYLNNNKIESHLINIKKKKEIKINDFVKSYEEFFSKIKDMIYKKYPSYIANELVKSDAIYAFNSDYLTLYYYLDKEYSINISYPNIKEYLDFPVNGLEFEDSGYNYDPNKVSIALTFDDGPNGNRTKRLIDTLEDYKMSATFFMVGNKLLNGADSVKYVYNSHSEVGFHSFNHAYMTMQSTNQIKNELSEANKILSSITNGGSFKLTRPPYGSFNKNVLDSLDTPVISWNLDTNDWRYKDVEYIMNYVLTNIKDGAIILFHDSYDTSVEAVINLVKILYEKDIQVMSVTNLANLKEITLNPHEVYFNISK